MKNILNFLKNIIIIAYIILIIFVTICLLSYNDYKVTVLGKTTLLPVIDEDLETNFNKGDLLLIERNRLTTIKEGDEVFFYRKRFGETTVNYAVIKAIDRVSESEFTYTIDGDYKFSSSNFIGKLETTTVIPKVGRVISILESKWGFLFLGVFPSLVAFFFTLHSVIQEATDGDEEETEKPKKSNNVAEEKDENKEEVSETKVTTEIEEVKEKPKEDKEEVSEVEKQEEVKEEIKEENVVEENSEKTEDIEKENVEENKEEQNKKEENQEIEEKQEEVSEEKAEDNELQKKRAAIEAKMKSMTEEEKKALIKAKLDSMTDEEKRALIEAKKKKIEAEKNKKGDQ